MRMKIFPEAETVIADDLPRLDEGKKLLREQTADVKRHKLKKTKLNTIFSSDEEEEEIQEPDFKLQEPEKLPEDDQHPDFQNSKATTEISNDKTEVNKPEVKEVGEKERNHQLEDRLPIKKRKCGRRMQRHLKTVSVQNQNLRFQSRRNYLTKLNVIQVVDHYYNELARRVILQMSKIT